MNEQEMQAKAAAALGRFRSKAEEYTKDPDKLKQVLEQAVQKATQNGPLDKIWDSLQLLFGLVRDWVSGAYREVPKGSVVAIVAGLLYLVSPIDVIPDFIPVLGLLDDLFVLTLVLRQVNADLEKYRAWREGAAGGA